MPDEEVRQAVRELIAVVVPEKRVRRNITLTPKQDEFLKGYPGSASEIIGILLDQFIDEAEDIKKGKK